MPENGSGRPEVYPLLCGLAEASAAIVCEDTPILRLQPDLPAEKRVQLEARMQRYVCTVTSGVGTMHLASFHSKFPEPFLIVSVQLDVGAPSAEIQYLDDLAVRHLLQQRGIQLIDAVMEYLGRRRRSSS